MHHQVVFLHKMAPSKPAPGESCNGCGVCCAAQTCPVAKVFLLQMRGPCRALQWEDVAARYRCGLLDRPAGHLGWLPAWSEKWIRSGVRRWIAAGSGCDSESATMSFDGGKTPAP